MASKPNLIIQNLSFDTPDHITLFNKVNLTVNHEKIGLVGRNGCGKTTLLRLIIGELTPSSGTIINTADPGYCPQNFDTQENQTLLQSLGINKIIQAIQRFSDGHPENDDMDIIGHHWDLNERIANVFSQYHLEHLDPNRKLMSLSGGEKTRLLLAKLSLSPSSLLILDEPTNNLDITSREKLYKLIEASNQAIIIASHDRVLLDKMDKIIEINQSNLAVYGGNYTYYQEQKSIAEAAIAQEINTSTQLLKKADKTIQHRKEKFQQNVSKGVKARKAQLRAKGNVDRITFNASKDKSAKTGRRITIQADRKHEELESRVLVAKSKSQKFNDISIDLNHTRLASNKMVLDLADISFSHDNTDIPLFENFTFSLIGPDRVALMGDNGSGKTTLLNLITNKIVPSKGNVKVGISRLAYLDQKVSLLNHQISIIDNYLEFNPDSDITNAYRTLDHFLFRNQEATQRVESLSGGEKLRAALACLLTAENAPQLIILDEPTNHLDIYSLNALIKAINQYHGAILVVSHDRNFLENININRYLTLKQ